MADSFSRFCWGQTAGAKARRLAEAVRAETGVSRGLPGQRSSWSCESAANPAKSEPAISIDSVAVYLETGGTGQIRDRGKRPQAPWSCVCRWSERQARLPRARGERVPQTPPACLRGFSGALRRTDRKMAGKMGGRDRGTGLEGGGNPRGGPGAPVCGAGVRSKRTAPRRTFEGA